MNVLFHGAIKGIFSVPDRFRDKFLNEYIRNNYRRLVEYGLFEVVPEEGYFDDALTDDAIIDKCIEDENTSVEDCFEDVLNCVDDYKKRFPDTEILDVSFGNVRVVAAVYKDKISETEEFLKYFKIRYEFNPDYEKDIGNLEKDAEDAIREAEAERKAEDAMRRSSYYW